MLRRRSPDFTAAIPRLGRRTHPARALVWLFLLLITVGGSLLLLPASARGEPADISTAFFTATSAVCVTGLVVVDTASYWSPLGQAVILLLIQVGGLGYMAASTLLAMMFGRLPGLRSRLVIGEALGEVSLRDSLRLVYSAIGFTVVVEAVGAAILTARFASEPGRTLPEAAWRGIFHSVSAFCNAGFDLFGLDGHQISSLGGYQDDWVVTLTIAALIIVGGLGFTVCTELICYRGKQPLSLHTRLVLATTAVLLGVGTLAFLATEWTNPRTLALQPLPVKLLTAFFQSVAARTAGFATVDFGGLRSITLMVLGLFMVIGVAPGGTGGGVKVTTFAVTLAAVWASLKGQVDVEAFGRRVPASVIYRALVLMFLSLAAIITGTFILVSTEPPAIIAGGVRDNLFVRIQFEAMSAFGTVGLSTGITPLLSEPGRLVIMALMFIGRLGPITVATAWTALGPLPRRRYPEEKVALG